MLRHDRWFPDQQPSQGRPRRTRLRKCGCPTSRSARVSTPSRAALADARRRRRGERPSGAGKTTVVPLALLDAAWRGDGKIVVLEPRRLATRAPPGGWPSCRPACRRARRLPDPRRTGHRAGDPHRSAHRGRADEAAAARPRTAGRRRRALRRGPRTQPHDRPRPGADPRRRLDAAARPAHRRDVGDRRHGTRSPGSSPSAEPAGVVVEGRTGPSDRRPLAPAARAIGLESVVERAVRGAARERRRRARVPARHRRDHALPRPTLVAGRGRSVDVRPLAGALALDEQDLALAPSPPGRRRGRAGHRHRRDVAHRRGRARRRRQRARPVAALRHRRPE